MVEMAACVVGRVTDCVRCILTKDIVVKSRRKRQQETDSCINSREDTVVSVTLSPSLSVAVPSFFLSLSLLQVLAYLPSFLLSFLLFPCDVTRSSGKCTQNKKNHPFSRYRAYLYYCEIS